MISVTIVGSGNVAFHLAKAFIKSDDVELKQLYTRNPSDLAFWKAKIPTTNDVNSLVKSDVVIMAISDDSIREVSQKIYNPLVVHTSGAKGLNELHNSGRKGVFYPLQSFSKKKDVDFTQLPICIEAENDADYKLLTKLASTINADYYRVNSEQRRHLHVAAVFANNFSNHMYTIAKEICSENEVPFDVLKPLILETANKINVLQPSEAQTGPAERGDSQTINKHLSLLNMHQQELYQKITESIQYYGEKL